MGTVAAVRLARVKHASAGQAAGVQTSRNEVKHTHGRIRFKGVRCFGITRPQR